MTDACSDPHLLLGEYALRMNFITLDTLQDVLEVWTVEKQSSLGQTLVERGHISSSQLDVLEQQVRKYLQRRALEPDQDSTQLAVRTHPDSGRQSPDNGTASDGLPFTGDSGRSESSSQSADQSILHFEAESLLDQSMDPHQEGLTQEEPAPSERRFQVLRPHAEGGIGVVSVAVDREFNREVAFKEIKRHFRSQKGVRKRFLLEAEVTARLEHPGIVPVYGLGYLQDGRPFYAMRLIRGETLKESIRSFHRKRISDPKQIGTSRRAYGNNVEFRELISRFIDVCFAIDYAHSRGVLHRDLKPGNIMLGKYGETLVVDWGLAKVVASSEDTLATEIEVPVEVETEAPTEMDGDEDIIRVPASRESLTETHFGRAIGTPAFMSPEQADGRMEELTATTDIYSLGATLYQILTGQTPINASPEGSRVSRLRQSELLRRVREGEFPHPRQINPNVSRGLESVCLKAMALHPDDRYQSVEELVQELQAWMADEPVLAWSEPWTVRTRRWVRGHQVVVGIAVTALLILAVVSPVLTIQRSQYAAEQKESAVKETVLRRRAEKERLDAVSARDAQARLASQARQAETLARLNEQTANRKAEEARRNLKIAGRNSYSSDMRLAQLNWENANVGPIVETINRYRGLRELKGFEWGYWNRLTHSELQTLKGHSANVTCVSFSPDGQWLAATGDNAVRIWNVATGQEKLLLQSGPRYLKSVTFSPDGTQLAAASANNSISVWDAVDGHEIHSLTGHTDQASSVSFSPDGTQIVSSSYDQTLKLWDAVTGKALRTLRGHTNRVNCVAFTTDGKRIVSGSTDHTVRLWDAASGELLSTLEDYNVTTLSVSPDGNRLATGSTNTNIALWDLARKKRLRVLAGHTHRLQGVAFSPDGRRLASGSADRTVRIWDIASGKQTMMLKGHVRPVSSVAFSPDGTQLASPGHGSTVKLWDVQTGQDTLTLAGHTGGVDCAEFSPDGKQLVSAGEDGTVRLWEAETGHETRILNGHTDRVTDVAFHPDGKRLASAGSDMTVRLWDVGTGQEKHRLEGHDKSVSSLSFSPDGTRLASADAGRQVIVWESDTGQKQLTLTARSSSVFSVCFSPDGQQLVTAGADGIVNLWDLKTQQVIRPFPGHHVKVHQVSFSPDGKRLVSASNDGIAVVWDVATAKELQRLKGHTNAIYDVSFSPDGKRITTGSSDATVKVWDTSSGQELLTLKGHRNWVTGVSFSPQGLRLASTSADGTVKIWDARPRTEE